MRYSMSMRNLEKLMLSERSQMERATYGMIPLI